VVSLCFAAVQPAWAISWGAGPGDVELAFYRGQNSIHPILYTVSSTDGLEDDTTCVGYKASFIPAPSDFFCSFDPLGEVQHVEVVTGGMYGVYRHEFEAYVGRVSPNAPPGLHHFHHKVSGIWEPTPQMGAGANLDIDVTICDGAPEPTIITLFNDTDHPIYDGVIRIDYDGNRLDGGDRFIYGITVPARGSTVVQDILDPGIRWSFGGLWDDGIGVRPIISFDASGASPEGVPFEDAFRVAPEWYATPYPDSGYVAATAGLHHGKQVLQPFLSYLEIGSAPQEFGLYAFSEGQKVGHGTAKMIPEPATLVLLTGGLAGFVLRNRRRRRQAFPVC